MNVITVNGRVIEFDENDFGASRLSNPETVALALEAAHYLAAREDDWPWLAERVEEVGDIVAHLICMVVDNYDLTPKEDPA